MSDNHLDYTQYGKIDRRKDFYFALAATVDDMIAAGVDAIINTGDMFNSNRPSSESVINLQHTHEILIGYKKMMYMVSGNHDYTVPPWTDILRPATAGGIRVVDNKGKFKIGPLTAVGYPTMARETLMQRFATDDLEGVDILMLHQLVKEFVGFPPVSALSIDDIPDKFQLVALGDVHVTDIRKRQSGNWIGYPGSTELNSESESEHKWWLCITVSEDGKIEDIVKHPIRSRPVWRWNVKTEDDLTKLLDGVDQAVLKLRDKRMPIVIFHFPTTMENAIERVRNKLDPNQFIILEKPEYVPPAVETVKIQESQDDISVTDILKMCVPENAALFNIAAQLLNPDTDANFAMDQFVQQRLKELEVPT